MKFSIILPSPKTFSSMEEFEKVVFEVSKIGYDAIELQLGDASDIDVDYLQNLLERAGTKLSSFQTGASYASNGYCYSSSDENKRIHAIEKMHRFVDFGAKMHAFAITGLLQGRRNDEPDEALAYERIYEAMSETSAYAEKMGVTVLIEPCNKMEVGFNNNVARVTKTVETVNSQALRTMVDTYHANIEEADVCDALRRCAPIMKHVHLSETNRSDFGTGHLDFVSVFRELNALKFDGYCAVGVYFTEQDLVTKARQAFSYVQAASRLAECIDEANL